MLRKTLMIMGFACMSMTVHAEVEHVTAKVTRVLHVDDDIYGGCMAKLSVTHASKGLDCSAWLTFSCTGKLTTKDNAYRKYDMAQMALALDKTVVVYANDAKKHNGFCYVERIDVLK